MLGLGFASWQVAARVRAGPQAILGPALLALWDAERLDTLALAGANVNGWTDTVGGAVLTQTVSGYKPLWSASDFGGRAAVTFDGTDDFLTLEGVPAALPTGAAPGEIWWLGDQRTPASDTSFRRLVAYGGTGNANSRQVNRTVPAGVARAMALAGDGTTSASISETLVDATGRHVVRARFEATRLGVAVDGQAMGFVAVAGLATGTTRVRLGATTAAAPGSFANVACSALLFTTLLSDVQAAMLAQWLKDRGGIA
ncbi:hypothetical protein ACG3SL_17000 [Sphingomonas sp. CJ20]